MDKLVKKNKRCGEKKTVFIKSKLKTKERRSKSTDNSLFSVNDQ